MPQIIIHERQDREGPVQLTVGQTHRALTRNVKTAVSEAELEALQRSHEGNYITVLPELNDGDAHRPQRALPDSGGNEAGAGADRKLR